ncbi:acyl-CoA dehydrogenase family protein [Micromonospora halophytica]|uniref:Acyl-[acyl-carrier-protein] dehydrogenase MbtN n=1 Tax=Micromonospora halophytica TaxID=47864 RepID=A0A1C5I7K1_9ACTN|nr:acyl-CoA dehydrogenase [Micromonospora halophytica]SCG54300.1 citronellyl-CoA dehydrogenase [Micromonospora halophytica]
MSSPVTATERKYRDSVRAALTAIGPDPRDWAVAGHLPREVFPTLAEHGVFRDRWLPGAAPGVPRLIAMAEELSEFDSGLALAAMGHSEVFIGALRWLAAGSTQQALLDDALDGRAVGCFGATEPHGGSDLSGLRTTATPQPDGWHLVGRKRYVSNLGAATHLLAVARVAGSGPRDLALFLVPLDAPGVRIEGFFATAGLRSCDVGEVSLDTPLGPQALLGAPGMGLAYASRLLQFERLSICAQLLTAGRMALGLAAAYARRRMIEGKPLLDKQAVRHRLAHAHARLGVAAAALRDTGARAVAGEGFAHEVAALKLVVCDTVERVTDDCLQVFGARGYTTNFPLEGWWRDVRLARIGGGADEVLTELLAGRLFRADPRFDAELDLLTAADTPRL